MKNWLWIVSILLIGGSAWALESAGTVADTQGGSFITHNGQTSPIRFKQSVYQGDEVETKGDGSVKLLFVDDTALIIKESSKVKITQFLYNSKKRERKGVFNLLNGTMRTVVTNFFGKGEDVEIHTPTAVAGIRGTDVGAVVQKGLATFHCFDGTVFVFNVAFPKEVITLQKGESVTIHQDQPPKEKDVMPLPEGVQPSMQISLPPVEVSQSPAESTPTAGGPVTEGTPTAGGYVTEGTPTAGGYVTEGTPTAGGYVTESTPTAASQVVESTFGQGDYSTPEYTYDYTPNYDVSSTYGTGPTYSTSPPPDFESTAVSETEAVATTPTPSISATTILPGGTSQTSNPTTITITFP